MPSKVHFVQMVREKKSQWNIFGEYEFLRLLSRTRRYQKAEIIYTFIQTFIICYHNYICCMFYNNLNNKQSIKMIFQEQNIWTEICIYTKNIPHCIEFSQVDLVFMNFLVHRHFVREFFNREEIVIYFIIIHLLVQSDHA